MEFCNFDSNAISFNNFFQMGTNYKAALIPERIRETIHGWGMAARSKRKRRHGMFTDDSTIHTYIPIDEDDQFIDDPTGTDLASGHEVELQVQPIRAVTSAIEGSSRVTPHLRPSASISSSVAFNLTTETIRRSCSIPTMSNERK